MAKYRAIEPGLWEHPVLRRGGFVVRDLYVYLCGHCADDEGRLRVDAYTLLEGCFSRNDPVTLDQVAAALAYLAENDLLLLYGNGDCYGFPTGWFEHQYRLEYRQPSKLPPPPTDVASWEDVEVVRNEYSRQTGKKLTRSQTQVALRWKKHNNLVLVGNNLVSAETTVPQPCFSPKQALEVEVDVDVGAGTSTPSPSSPPRHPNGQRQAAPAGPERELAAVDFEDDSGNGRTARLGHGPRPAPAPKPGYTPEPTGAENDEIPAHIMLVENMTLRDFVTQARPRWGQRKRDTWVCVIGELLREHEHDVSLADFTGWFEAEETRPDRAIGVEAWWRRMMAIRGEKQRELARASPAKADPLENISLTAHYHFASTEKALQDVLREEAGLKPL